MAAVGSARDRIVGVQPVREALSAGVEISRLRVADGRLRGVEPIVGLAEAAAVPVERVPSAELDRLAGGLRHQGVVADAAPFRYRDLEELIERALSSRTPIVVADHVTDVGNLGSMLRAIEAAGGAGLVVAERRAASITAAVRKASAGASEHVMVARVTNLPRAIDGMKAAGLWVTGLDAGAAEDLYEASLEASPVLVVGSEGSGLSRLVRERCDRLVNIPMAGEVGSLNVAQALAVVLFEWRRRVGRPSSGRSSE